MAAERVSRTKVVLISCGSFNPITNSHLRMFETARDYLQSTGTYEVVQGVISPVHDGYKKPGLISASHRVKMCRLAVEKSEWISVDAWESEQPKYSTTLTVLEHFDTVLNTVNVNSPRNRDRASRPSAGGDEKVKVKLLCGADLLESFAKPGLWADEDLRKICGKFGMVVIGRAASNPEQFIYEHDIVYANKHNIHLATEWFTNDISSTKVRNAIRRNESINYVVQDPVILYIRRNNLYKTK